MQLYIVLSLPTTATRILYCGQNAAEENNREGVSANVDERTQWEMFYPPFQGAVDGGVGSIMCSLNKINEIWACENPDALTRDLKGRMNFTGCEHQCDVQPSSSY